MHKSIVALVGAAGIGVATLAAPASADCIGCAIGAGILGGVAAGAIVGSAIANSPPPPPPGYYPPPPAGYPPPPPGAAYSRPATMLSWHQVVIGDTSASGSTATAISGSGSPTFFVGTRSLRQRPTAR